MVFSSNIFLFVFLPLFLAVYYLIPFRFRSALILVASYGFYGWWRLDFLALFFLVTLWSYVASLLIVRAKTPAGARRAVILGVAVNLAALGYFKYFNFGVDAFNDMLVAMGSGPLEAWQVLLPIGISFYVFHAISYLVDIWRRDATPADSFWDFAAFIALFPQLVAGPVLRYKDLQDQFRARVHSMDKFSEGAARFMIGFCKKVLIADTIAPLTALAFDNPDPSFAEAWLGTLAYAAQLYFDFSGYSDMAIGLGLMMGFRFLENFNQPYISRSITEFWRRWHISLSNWLRDYLYIPLGGNRKGRLRTYVNLFLTMLLGGFWHGASWNFVLWGAWHGGWLALERWRKERGAAVLYPLGLALHFTFLLVVIGWVLFRAPDLASAGQVYSGMLGANGLAIGEDRALQVTGLQLFTLLLAYFLIFAGPLKDRLVRQAVETRAASITTVLFVVFVGAVLKLSAQAYSPFLYFQF